MKPMPATSQMRAGHESLRWTPAWVLVISMLTPASAWALHTVMPELVAWYIGIMGWLILTPEKGPRLRLAQAQGVSNPPMQAESQASSGSVSAEMPKPVLTESGSSTDSQSADNAAAKTRKPRSRARKPKAMTLAEVKALTGSADRAVVWSQVGPGKFVRQPGDESPDGANESEEIGSDAGFDSGQVIETVVRNSAIVDESEQDNYEDRDQEIG